MPTKEVKLTCAKVTLENGTVMAGWKVAKTGELLKNGCQEGMCKYCFKYVVFIKLLVPRLFLVL